MRTDNTYMLTSRPFYTFNFFVKKKISSLNKTMKFFFILSQCLRLMIRFIKNLVKNKDYIYFNQTFVIKFK